LYPADEVDFTSARSNPSLSVRQSGWPGFAACDNTSCHTGYSEECDVFNLVFALAALLAASIHVALSPKRRSDPAAIAATYLIYLLFFYVGVMGVFTAYAHVFRPVQTSASIGWSTSPYEYEVGMADLTVGVLGILCLWFRGNFWLATAIANAVWLLGDAVGHIRQEMLYNNHAANNSGIFLAAEIITPLLILFLAFYNRRTSP
jgi:hypothetical protein